MTPEPTRTDPAIDGDARLRAEHDADEAALARTLPGPGDAPTEPLGVPAESTPSPLPPSGGLRRRTQILLGLLAAGVLFFAGVQCQKLTGGRAAPAPGPGAGAAPATTPEPSPPAARIVQGEILALRGSTLYVREAGGDVVRLRAGGASRVLRAQPSTLRGVRPGERVVAELQPGEPATAISVTVLDPRDRGP